MVSLGEHWSKGSRGSIFFASFAETAGQPSDFSDGGVWGALNKSARSTTSDHLKLVVGSDCFVL